MNIEEITAYAQKLDFTIIKLVNQLCNERKDLLEIYGSINFLLSEQLKDFSQEDQIAILKKIVIVIQISRRLMLSI